MVFDTFLRGSSYGLGPLWEKIFPELQALAANAGSIAEGHIFLAGGPGQGGVLANVEVYSPKSEDDARYESHSLMADIQVVLEGDEFVDVFPLNGQETPAMHDPGRDLMFYSGKKAPAARIHLTPGMFALIMPGEAHKPCLKAASATVKKLVVKIPAEKLLAPAFV